MTKENLLLIIGGYFLALYAISKLIKSDGSNDSFFTGKRSSKWYLVAFGMIGTSLSGVTFISVPGWVGSNAMAYMQVVLGYFIGYAIIAQVLLPLFYKSKITSIYSILEESMGKEGRLSAAIFFQLSRILGASFRLYLVCIVLNNFLLADYNLPFWVSVIISIGLILVYTQKGGIKTIVITDTIQTLFMLLAVGVSLYAILSQLDMSIMELIQVSGEKGYTEIFNFNDVRESGHFLKQFFGGALIALTMTGLDQDMMQKNLSCKSLKESQKNMWTFSTVLIFVNAVFLLFGAALLVFASEKGIALPSKTDEIFPMLALDNHLGVWPQVLFALGLIAAAYSSADSAIAALTTSMYCDVLSYDKKLSGKEAIRKRKLVQTLVCVLVFVVIVLFNAYNEQSVIGQLLYAATYTYGPILALFAMHILKIEVKFRPVIYAAVIISPVLCYLLNVYDTEILGGYDFGYEMLLVNALLTMILCVVPNYFLPNKTVNKQA
jgi:Na+/proline symporter